MEYTYTNCVPIKHICSAVRVSDDNFTMIKEVVQREMVITTDINGCIKSIQIGSLTADNGEYILRSYDGSLSVMSRYDFRDNYVFLTHE